MAPATSVDCRQNRKELQHLYPADPLLDHHRTVSIDTGNLKHRIRITAHFIDGESDAHLWAERYDRVLAEVFTLQDEFSMCGRGHRAESEKGRNRSR